MSKIVGNSDETTPKQRAGRPYEGRRRREIMASDDEWNSWREAAGREGTSVSDVIRRLMNAWAADEPKQPANDA